MPNTLYTNSVPRSLSDKLGETPSALDFGALRDGATDNAAAFAALAVTVNTLTLGGIPTITFPPGHYKYSGGLVFTKQVRLYGPGATLEYTGTGKAVQFGPTDMTAHADDQQHYEIEGITMTGGASMTHGLYFSPFVTMPRLKDVYCYNFGNASAWSIFFQASNWDIVIINCRWYTTWVEAGGVARNWVRVNGASVAGATDYGNSRLRMHACLGTNLDSGVSRGVYVTGVHSLIQGCKIEGFSPSIQMADTAPYTKIVENYLETTHDGNAITYGSDGADYWPAYLTVENCYCNVHNTDAINTDAYFLGPSNANVGLQNATIRHNHITACNRELVFQNNLFSQINNYAEGNSSNFGATHLDVPMHTAGANISSWNGLDGDELLVQNYKDEARYIKIRSGLTAPQYQGLTLQDHSGNEIATIEMAPSGRLYFKNKDASEPTDPALVNAYVLVSGQWVLDYGASITGLAVKSKDKNNVAAYINGVAGQVEDICVMGSGLTTALRVTGDNKVIVANFNPAKVTVYDGAADSQLLVKEGGVQGTTLLLEAQKSGGTKVFGVAVNGDVTCRKIEATGAITAQNHGTGNVILLKASGGTELFAIDNAGYAYILNGLTIGSIGANKAVVTNGDSLTVGLTGAAVTAQALLTGLSTTASTAIPAAIDTTGMTGDALTIANKVNDIIGALGAGATVIKSVSAASKALTVDRGIVTVLT